MTGGGLGIAHLADIEPIELGGAGDLYAATELKLERRVAIRVLPPLADEAARSRFSHESRVLGLLSSHPNVVTVYNAGLSEQGRPFLVLELLDGTNLVDHLEANGPLPWSEAVDVALQICSGLAGAQRAGAMHGDLRPENVFVAGPSVKLGDMGLLSTSTTDRSTGDPADLLHMAPEALDARRDERSDLYSVASILYQLIDGRAPFWRPSDSVDTLRNRVATQAAPPLDPDLAPDQIRAFVAAALSKDPIDRPQTADEFVRELDLIRRGRTTGSTPSVLHGTTLAMPVVAIPPSADRTAPPDPTVPSTREELGVGARPADPPATSPVPAGLSVSMAAGFATVGVADQQVSIDAPSTSTATSPVPAGRSSSPVSDLWGPPTSTGTDRAAAEEPAPEPVNDPWPVEPRAPLTAGGGPQPRGPFGVDRSPAFLGAMAMIAVGLIGLIGVAAFGLLSSGDGVESGAPELPGGETTLDAEGTDPGPATTLTPLAMLPSSTTTTAVSDDDMMSTTTTEPLVTVPNLVGQAVENAGAILSDAGFQVLVVGRVSPGAVPGTVTQQVPAAGSVTSLPLTVTLYIPRSSSMPAVVGRPADTVCLQLTALGLTCEQTMQFNDRVAAGSVISSDPVEGAGFSIGDTVRLRVSRGPRVEVSVPEVGGRSEADAREILSQAGFLTIATRAQASDAVQQGQAIGTTPAAGSAVAIDEPITIVISSGPAPRVTVPEIIGTDRATAEARLTQAGLTANIVGMEFAVGAPEIGRVVAADPGQGVEVAAGSSVTITVGQPAAATPTTAAG